MNTIELLTSLMPIIQKHDQKVFGKRFENDLKAVHPKAYISSYAGLQYIYIGDERVHIGWDKQAIDAKRVCAELEKQIEYYKESQIKKAQDASQIDTIKAKFEQLKTLINELDDVNFELKNELKSQYDIDFKTYYRK